MNHQIKLLIIAALASPLLVTAPATAMCGGNIFTSCPPSPQAAQAAAAQAKREKRLEAVRAKKSHRRLPGR
jgi:hypothetical protein